MGEAILAYIKEIVVKGIPVPVDLNRQEEIEEAKRLNLPIYEENGATKAAFVPLKEVRARCSHPKENQASRKILEHILERFI